ncbi:glycerol-3-phosphate 1-O-acyltransferase PlsB [Kangiella sp. TOML190]|uniref:glycerol-3-phosphate 1-O-acyltransferase PlsB n=1 Tax=Kangiella sp. TOML190 TaxID=2931351 RepID=UPI00203C595F|nr:glycerol-3-phosphate 1-O-acyltransferase PlsB [Kangiella sp. TOML190]
MSIIDSISRFALTLFRKPFHWLVKAHHVPKDPRQEFELDKNDKLVYVLRTKSLSSIEILKRQTKMLEMVEARHFESGLPKSGTCIFINNRPKWFSNKRKLTGHKKSFAAMLEAQKNNPDVNYKIIPVSVFWGRNPGKEKSFLRYAMSNLEETGRLGKLLIILFLGRQCFIQYGKPIDLNSEQINLGQESDKTAHKLSRILRIYFNRHWVAVMGPRKENRRDLISGIIASDPVQKVIIEEASRKNKTMAKVRSDAEKYIKEIAANYNPRTVRFLSTSFTRLWNKIYSGIEVNNIKQVRELAQNHELIYVPCHRSHTDYLLLSYQLYHEGLVPPHIAAGINLNFWPVGNILRKGGAFFLRRTFKGNKLYTAVFNEYLYRLLNKGAPVEYFQEGGRSRTGRLLTPKTGMLGMTVQGMLRGIRKPIVFIPVYIGYEKMFEGKSYVGELRGQAKKQESFGQLLGVRKALKRFYGKVYLNFGEPLKLTDYLDQQLPHWKESLNIEQKPDWLNQQMIHLGDEINRRINAAVSINSVCLVSMALLGTPRQAMDKAELIAQLDTLLAFAKDAPYSPYTNVSQQSGSELVATAIKLGMAYETNDPAGNVISIEGDERVLSTYYSNNILHLFALPSLIASLFQRHNHVPKAKIMDYIHAFYPFLKKELYIHWTEAQLAERVDTLLATMLEHGLLNMGAKNYCVPHSDTPEWSRLMLLAEAIQPALQRYAISLTLLNSLDATTSIKRVELEQESQKLAQRISALYGINAPEFFDKNLFKNQVKVLKEEGYINHQEGSGIRTTDKAQELYRKILNILSIPVQQGLQLAARSLKVTKPLESKLSEPKSENPKAPEQDQEGNPNS